MENEFSLLKCLADKRGLLLGGYFNEEFVKKKNFIARVIAIISVTVVTRQQLAISLIISKRSF